MTKWYSKCSKTLTNSKEKSQFYRLSTDFLYYMKRKMEISEHNDKVRKRIFHAYKSGFGPKLGEYYIKSLSFQFKTWFLNLNATLGFRIQTTKKKNTRPSSIW